MNRLGEMASGRAELDYRTPEYRIVRPGAYVLCAVTGKQIPLGELKYWSVAAQEAYASAEIATERHDQLRRSRK